MHHHDLVSFDIFLQCFDDTSAVSNAVLMVLLPFIAEAEGTYARITTEDGEADVYGIGTSHLMINHASGKHIWQILIDVARAAHMAIMPTGCPTCVVDTATVARLPAELRQDVVLVTSGHELLNVILTN